MAYNYVFIRDSWLRMHFIITKWRDKGKYSIPVSKVMQHSWDQVIPSLFCVVFSMLLLRVFFLSLFILRYFSFFFVSNFALSILFLLPIFLPTSLSSFSFYFTCLCLLLPLLFIPSFSPPLYIPPYPLTQKINTNILQHNEWYNKHIYRINNNTTAHNK